ncbi:hypothetical protein BC827DRAFT_1156951 [Russula dissimulans]|nr:hypothetical protein BC827DRAFT_1156951 [Russula dissimulans]
MSRNSPENTSSSNYQLIFDNALKAYKKKTGKNLRSDPLLLGLGTCDSPDALLNTLRQHVPTFDQSASSDARLTNWINLIVNVLATFSTSIGAAVSLAYPPVGWVYASFLPVRQFNAQIGQAAQAVNASQGVLVDLFERIENFFKRLEAYVELPPTEGMTHIIVKVMAEVLLILALATKEIKQGRTKKLLKKLVGRSDIEDALRRLDKLTQEESLMAAAQGLRATHGVSEAVNGVASDVHGVDDKVKGVHDKIDIVINSMHPVSTWPAMPF